MEQAGTSSASLEAIAMVREVLPSPHRSWLHIKTRSEDTTTPLSASIFLAKVWNRTSVRVFPGGLSAGPKPAMEGSRGCGESLRETSRRWEAAAESLP